MAKPTTTPAPDADALEADASKAAPAKVPARLQRPSKPEGPFKNSSFADRAKNKRVGKDQVDVK